MSLVGSLEDLGLGDILQIVSLSRKSGLLMIHSDEGAGRIVFCDGLVRAAFVKGEPDDLRGLLVPHGFVDGDAFDEAVELANARGEPLDKVIPERTPLTRERLDSLRREHVERAVFQIFGWQGGEFSFEVRDEIDPRDAEILLPMGINAQYLTMEATRMGDEDERALRVASDDDAPGGPVADAAFEPPDDEPMFSGEAQLGEASAGDDAALEVVHVESGADPFAGGAPEPFAPRSEAGDEPGDPNEDTQQAHEIVAIATAEREGTDVAPPPAAQRPRVLIAIDSSLSVLEWQKASLKDLFERVHIFQNSELGVERIRQYLARGRVPVVVVSDDESENAAIPAGGIEEFTRRLKHQAPTMTVLVTAQAGAPEPDVPSADAIMRRPGEALLGRKRANPALEAAVARLREDVVGALSRSAAPEPAASGAAQPARAPASAGDGLQRLRATSEQMRDPARRGEALAIVLEFAAESYNRVAIFMVRDDRVIGIAQSGLPGAGGPDDEAFRELTFEVDDVGGVGRVVEQRRALCAAPRAGDIAELTARLGDREPREAYLAPIESGGEVVALLYADQLPGAGAIGDTTILEIVLHEAGLAIERALLERALAEGAAAD